MKIDKKTLSVLQKLAITYQEYKKLHPRTKKTPDDPLFTLAQDPNKKEFKVKPKDIKTVMPSKTPTKSVPQKTDDPVEKFRPKLAPSAYQKQMDSKELLKNAKKMSSDDMAWHLLNSKIGMGFESGELRDQMKSHFGIANMYAMMILNPNISKESRDNIASWLLDKAGVYFVSSKSLKRFLEGCANKGIISKEIWEEESNGDSQRKEEDEIAQNYTADQLKKLPAKKIQENWSEICQNENLPTSMIQKMLGDKDVKKALEFMKKGYIEDTGAMSGKIGERKNKIGKALKILSHKNVPFEALQEVFVPSLKQHLSTNNYKAYEVAEYLASHPDINKPENSELKKLVLQAYTKNLKYYKDDPEWVEDPYKYNRNFDELKYPSAPPANLKLSKEEFLSIWKIRGASSFRSQNEGWFEHPDMPDEIIKESLAKKDNKVKDPLDKYLSDYSEVRNLAFHQARKRNLLSDDDLVKTVKANLNLQGDDNELIKKFAEQAYTYGKSSNNTPRYISKGNDDERKAVEEQMKKTAFHEEFDFEVSAVYNIDKEPHKDFAKTSKKLGNVLEGVYHGTSYANAAGILSDGVRVDTEERTGSMFGRGFYLASASSKAAQYAGEKFSQHDGDGVVFMLNVALGKSKEMKYGRPEGDNLKYRMLSPEEKQMVEDYKKKTGKDLDDKWHYEHDSVTAKAGQALDYDEFVVKDPSQLQIKKIVIVKKTPKAKV